MIYRKAPLIFLVVCGFILFIFFTAEDQGPIASPLQSQKFLQLPPKLMTQGMWLNMLLPWSYSLKFSVWKQGLLKRSILWAHLLNVLNLVGIQYLRKQNLDLFWPTTYPK